MNGILGVYNNILYFKNSNSERIYLKNISILRTNCKYTGSIEPNSIGEILFDNCTSNLEGKYNIIVFTKNKIYSKYLILNKVEILTGSLVDSPVEGVYYNTSSGLSGITNKNGDFKYRDGDIVTFILGNTSFSVLGKNYITPLVIFNTSNLNDSRVINFVRLLIGLDLDSNPINGIYISSSILELISINLDFNQTLSNFEDSIPLELNITLVNETIAIQHLQNTINLINGVEFLEDNSYLDLNVESSELDLIPNSFLISSSLNNSISNEVVSEEIIVSGFDGNLSISVDNGALISINNGDWLTSSIIFSNDSFKIKVNSSSNWNSSILVNISLGNYSTLWEVRTEDYENLFRSLWNVSIDQGLTGYNNLTLPLHEGGNYNFTVYWGDGEYSIITSWNDSNNFHSYLNGGEYELIINGLINNWGFDFGNVYEASYSTYYLVIADNNDDGDKLINILNWGNLKLIPFGSQFLDCDNLINFSATDSPNLTGINNLSFMLAGSFKFNGDLSNWDVSNVTDMSWMFYDDAYFNQDIGNWNVGNVKKMKGMFLLDQLFNQDIGDWDVSSVTDMSNMFYKSYYFNQDIGNWNVSSVTDMSNMFNEAENFNQDIGNWNVSSVTDMSNMFKYVSSFNQDISSWDVSNLINMGGIFNGARSFDQDIGNWNVSSVTDMSNMFNGASSFNQDIGNWDVSSVTDMTEMFENAEKFNQEISDWNVSSVTDMSDMFKCASSFNQDIGNWDVSSVRSMDNMFNSESGICDDMSIFNQDISNWDVSSVEKMEGIFYNAENFNQNLSLWDTSKVIDNNCDSACSYSGIEGKGLLQFPNCDFDGDCDLEEDNSDDDDI